MSKYYSFSFASILATAVAAPAIAQETQPVVESTTEQEGVISYTPADFAAARPNTALDMINRLPGFTFDGGDNVRGFAGAAGNVLIDGQRPTIKTDTLGDTLARITIDQVERIDLDPRRRAWHRHAGPHRRRQRDPQAASTPSSRCFPAQAITFAQTGHTLGGWNYQATRRSGEHQFDVQLSARHLV